MPVEFDPSSQPRETQDQLPGLRGSLQQSRFHLAGRAHNDRARPPGGGSRDSSGLVLALLKISRSRILSWPAQAYIDVFRGTPLLVQITIIYFTTASVGIRFESLFFAGLVALSLNSGLRRGDLPRRHPEHRQGRWRPDAPPASPTPRRCATSSCPRPSGGRYRP